MTQWNFKTPNAFNGRNYEDRAEMMQSIKPDFTLLDSVDVPIDLSMFVSGYFERWDSGTRVDYSPKQGIYNKLLCAMYALQTQGFRQAGFGGYKEEAFKLAGLDGSYYLAWEILMRNRYIDMTKGNTGICFLTDKALLLFGVQPKPATWELFITLGDHLALNIPETYPSLTYNFATYMIEQGMVRVGGEVITDPLEGVEPGQVVSHDEITAQVGGEVIPEGWPSSMRVKSTTYVPSLAFMVPEIGAWRSLNRP